MSTAAVWQGGTVSGPAGARLAQLFGMPGLILGCLICGLLMGLVMGGVYTGLRIPSMLISANRVRAGDAIRRARLRRSAPTED